MQSMMISLGRDDMTDVEPVVSRRYSSQRQLSSSWYCWLVGWLGGWLVTVFLKSGSKDFLAFLHESSLL